MTRPTRKSKMKPHYSGQLSRKFWDRVNATNPQRGTALFQLGYVLQEVEARMLKALEDAEAIR